MRNFLLVWLLILSLFAQEFGNKSIAGFKMLRDRSGAEALTDNFGRLRTGDPYQTGGYFFTYSLKPEAFGTSTSGAGIVTHDNVEGLARVKSGSGVGTAKLRSDQYHLYQPDKAQEIDMSLSPGTAKTGVVKKWGYFDDDDGLYFKLEDDNKLQVCILTSTSGTPVESCVVQDDFNNDVYEHKTFMSNDWTPDGATIYRITFQWLGSGAVNFCIANNEGLYIPLHRFKNPFKNTGPYMKRAALPLSFEISSDETTTETDELKVICCAVGSNGGEDPTVNTFAAFLPSVGTTSDTNENHVMSFRLKELFKGQTNTTTIFPQSLDLVADGGTIRIRVYQNCDISGASWTDVNTEYSAAEYSTAGTISNCEKVVEARTLFGSTKAGTTIGSQGSVGLRAFKIVRKAFDGGGIFSITVERVGSTDADYDMSLRWGEAR